MATYIKLVTKVSDIMYGFAGIMLSFMMGLTVLDVVLRYLGTPIPGTYELVGLTGAVVIGFAIPYTSLVRGHIFVEFLIDRLGKNQRAVVLIFAKALILLLFIGLFINLLRIGMSMADTSEVTQILHIPFHPVVYAMAFCCFIECLVMSVDISRVAGGQHE